jgi:IS5 family transposase
MPRMLRIYFMQQWFNLSDAATEGALYESGSMRRFAGIDLAADLVPDETTILRFRHLLEKLRLTEKLFAEVRQLLEEKKPLLKSGAMVDATIIAPLPSTKNAVKEGDPEMRQTRKGKQWHFGMKLHVGTDRRGLVHNVATGPACQGDITRLDDLMHGDERELFGDQAYRSEDHRQHCRHAGIAYRVDRRAKPGRILTDHEKAINRSRSRHRARSEHAFHVVKHLRGFTRVRYRGLYKNTVRAQTMFALSNLYLARRLLMARQERCVQ